VTPMTDDGEPGGGPRTPGTDGLELTDEQRDALVVDRNVAITAGAGTGKTTTLTRRYLELLRSDPEVTPTNVVTITFTRKAAAELEERVREAVYDELAAADSPAESARWRTVLDELDDGYTHTIHAFCARVLREHAVQAPVPMAFDVLDEDDAADLQRAVASAYVDDHGTDGDVALLSKLFGSHGRLVDVLTGLLDERPDSEAWVDAWRDRDVEDYVEYLWEHVCTLDPADAAAFFDADEVQDALATARRFADEEFAVAAGADGVAVLREIADVADGVDGGDERAHQRACRDLYDRLETSSGGLYASASHHLVGTKAAWNDETDAYDACKDALGTLLDELSAIEDAVETTPGAPERASAHYVLALARTFDGVLDAYEAEKERREALDFPDLVETTTAFLDANPAVRASLRASFDAVMVDEFQDTDGRQWDLVASLAELADDGVQSDDVFLVGDKKQGIYGFRGAEVTTFDTARDALRAQNRALGKDSVPDGTQVSPTDLELSGNFRTLAGPLAFLNETFRAVFEPEGETPADYEAPPQDLAHERDRVEDVADLEGTVEYLVVPEDADDAARLLGDDHPVTDAAAEHATAGEAEALGARLARLLDDPPDVYDAAAGEIRPAVAEDVAVLLRRRTHLDRYQRALDAHGVPYSVVSGTGFYDTPAVRALVNLLRVLADPSDDVSLYAVLRSPLFGFTDDRLAPLAAPADSLWTALGSADDEQLREAADLLAEWRALAGCVRRDDSAVLPWHRVLTRVFDDTGYLVSVGAGEGGRQAVANVEKFRDEIRAWSEGGTRTAASVLRRIDRQADLDPREGEAEVPAGTDGVRVMTIHAAKGLEFPVVAVPDLGSDLNLGSSVDDYGHVRLVTDHDDDPLLVAGGPSPTDSFDLEQTTAQRYAEAISLPRERAEAKRLLYVACTRTRDHLLLCGTHSFTEGDDGPAFAPVNDREEATSWRDWLQPTLLEEDGLVGTLAAEGQARVRLGDASYAVRLPGAGRADPTPGDVTDDAEAEFPRIEIPDAPEEDQQRRVSATQLLGGPPGAAADGDDGGDGDGTRPGADDGATSSLPRHEFGTVVHRMLEFDRPREEWPALARRIAAVNGFEVTDDGVADIVDHVADAAEFLATVAAAHERSETYEEVSVSTAVDGIRVVGDVDHLRVTPDAFVVTDYKTNRVDGRTTADLAAHYRPQMASYALALLDHDPDREVVVNLRFTDAGTTESFRWDHSDRASLADGLVDRVASMQPSGAGGD
jgi:ATP-dependent helicase/nuclease subunit A